MARVSKNFAEKVSRYESGGTVVRSAEGAGIARSSKSLAAGKALARKNLARVGALRTDIAR
jgi:hypothetical protein